VVQPVSTSNLTEYDPLLNDIVRYESERQQRKIIMIASESICPAVVRQALSCEFSNIYAEGYPSPRTYFEPAERLGSFQYQLSQFRRYSNRRYYKGCEYVDILEQTARRRTAEVFANERVSAENIFVNVQPLSGAAANNAVYNAFVKKGDTVMGAALTHGGHLTHGSPVNRSGMNHKVVSYHLSHSGKLEYDAVAKLVKEHQPRLLIGGFSAYPWDIDWARMREIADSVGAILLADIAHLAGMVAAGLLNNPVGHAHVTSFTTHKTLCGPRGAMLLASDPEIAAKMDFGVFPGEQGGPHIHVLAAKAVAMKMAGSEEFRALQAKVLENAKALADGFEKEGLHLAYGGTNTHMCLVDLRKIKTPNGLPLTGEIASRILDLLGITCNKNTIAGDTNAIHPSALRFGSTWVTQRGFTSVHMQRLAAIVAKTLRGIHPFSYIGARLEWGRGKMEPALFEEIAADVAALIRDADGEFVPGEMNAIYPHFPTPATKEVRGTALSALHKSQAVTLCDKDGWRVPAHFGTKEKEIAALKEGTGLVDAGGALLVEVAQGRALPLLDGLCSADLARLEEGQATATLLLDGQGKPLARALAAHMPADEHGDDRLLLRVSTDDPDRILRWLRGISDGYLLHDEDLWIKCEGPAVIEDLSAPSDGRDPIACLGLRGPKAAEVLAKAFEGLKLEAGQFVAQNDLWFLSRPEHSAQGVDIFVPAPGATALWSKLLEAGAVACGCESMAQVMDKEALDENSDPLSAAWSDRLQMDKPFFIGQKALRARMEAPKAKEPFDWKAPDAELKETCLIEEHRKLAVPKHIVPFAGWHMPVMYEGILAEHEAVRRRVGLFDVSHMGVLDFKGAYAERYLDLITTNYVPMLVDGQAQYSYLLDHAGRCIDDIIICRMARDHFMMVVNAANADEDEAWMRGVAEGRLLVDPKRPDVRVGGAVQIRNLKDPDQAGDEARVDLALQGPKALALIQHLAEPKDRDPLTHLRKFFVYRATVAGIDTIVTRTGYTGEQMSFELYLHPDKAPSMWNALLSEGEAFGIAPCGLGARDSLRTEAGYPLHGHELAGPEQITPIEAGYGSFVKLHKPFFPGRDHCLEGHKKRERIIVRFEVDEKSGKVLRPGMPVVESRKGQYTGVVTSCTATGERQVGLALIQKKHAKRGNKLQILPTTEQDRKQPSAVTPVKLKTGDWFSVPRQATIRPRFMRPGEKPLKG